MEGTRLNKYISDSGFCSRREADRFIDDGLVSINGCRAVIGAKVVEGDIVKVGSKRVSSKDVKRVYIAFNKPIGVTCTTDTKEKNNIIDYINFPERIFHIGRLDKPSEGLIFLTNDGDIVNKILRSGNNHEKEYVVTVNKYITPEFAKSMASGVRILGVTTKRCKFIKESDTSFRIILTQGLNRQIRRMCEVLGYDVVKLKRVRVMNITLKGLPVGKWRFFTENEIAQINKLITSSSMTQEASLIDNLPRKKRNTPNSNG